MVIMDIPEQMFFGFVEGYSEPFDAVSAKKELMEKLLLCFLNDEGLVVWNPFCKFVQYHNLEDMKENPPAILWNEEYLSLLKGTYLGDRIPSSIQMIEDIKFEFITSHPEVEVRIVLSKVYLLMESGLNSYFRNHLLSKY